MAQTAVTGLGCVGLGVSDVSRWRVFAGEVLGMECVWRAGENLHLHMDYWNCRIRLHPRRKLRPALRGRPRDWPRRIPRHTAQTPPVSGRRWSSFSPAAADGPIGAAGSEAVLTLQY
jgi:hypothetical protein